MSRDGQEKETLFSIHTWEIGVLSENGEKKEIDWADDELMVAHVYDLPCGWEEIQRRTGRTT